MPFPPQLMPGGDATLFSGDFRTEVNIPLLPFQMSVKQVGLFHKIHQLLTEAISKNTLNGQNLHWTDTISSIIITANDISGLPCNNHI